MTNSDNSQDLKFRPNRTFICSVVFLDIIEYSKKTVEEQIILKERFNTLISETLTDIPVSDRIILDTGDGAAIGFLGDPEDALFVAMNIRDALNNEQATAMPDLRVRMGINLGPVKLLKDINNQINLIGDGINVAQRIMSFAEDGQLLVSRSYYDIVSCLSQEYAQLFEYKGARADKHIREHDIYAVGLTGLRSVPVHHKPEVKKSSAIVDNEIIDAGETPSKDVPYKDKTTSNKPGHSLPNKKIMLIAAPIIAIIVIAMFIFIPSEKDKSSSSKRSSKASRSLAKDMESKQAETEYNTGSNQESATVGSVRADEIEFIYAGVRSSGNEVTLAIRIRNISSVAKSVALYDNHVSWPKSKLADQAGNTYEVTDVHFTKGSQTITSKAAGTQGVSINPRETVSASLVFKKTGKGIKSINLHPFIYQGRGWKEHDLPMKINK
jgi:hypothetical protein